MTILLLLIPLSLLFVLIAIAAFVWAVKRGQFDDLDAAALDVLVTREPTEIAQDSMGNPPHAD